MSRRSRLRLENASLRSRARYRRGITSIFLVVSFVVLLLSTSFVAAQGKPLEDRLDTPLKLLYRSQLVAGKEAVPAAPDRVRALEILDRLRPERLRVTKRAGPATGTGAIRLPLLIEYTGDEARLEEVGFRRQATVGTIHTGTLDSDRLGDLLNLRRCQEIRRLSESDPSARPVSLTEYPEAFAIVALLG